MKFAAVAALLCASMYAYAGTPVDQGAPGDQGPWDATDTAKVLLNNGAVQCLTASATAIGSTTNRKAIAITNLGPNIIYLGTSTVTTSTGFPLAANGGFIALDLSLIGNLKVYCIAATGNQVSPSDTRFLETK
jgi:hypothetical protein